MNLTKARRSSWLATVLVCLFLCAQVAVSQKRVLVLLQSDAAKSKYSQFLDGLSGIGFDLDVKAHKASGLKLREYDTWLYDHLVIFAPKAEGFGGSIDVPAILDFIDSGRNVVLGATTDVSDTIRSLAAEVGVDLEEKGSKVFDHFNWATLNGETDHTLVAATDVLDSKPVLGNTIKAPILFRGVAATIPADAELVTVALSAPVTSYSHDPRKTMPDPPLAGPQISLVSLVQARNNARVLVSGSVDLFSNAFFDAEVVLGPSGKTLGTSGNRDFALQATRWALQDRGVLVAENLRHRLVKDAVAGGSWNSSSSPAGYRVLDDVEFAVDLWEVEGGVRRPYQADDVQVEFTMLDPHVRLPLETDGKGTFSVRFKVPDVYGVFKYVVDYRHQGYSYVQLTQQVPVRPFKHNEYERFLLCAYPYYASALSSMVAFFLLGFFFLYHKGA